MTFAENIKRIRKERNMTQDQFAELLGTSKQVLSRYENGIRTPKITVVAQFAAKLLVPVESLVGNTLPHNTIIPNGWHRIPIYGNIGAGLGKSADNYIEGYLMTESAADFAVRVDGDSMETTIMRGDLALIEAQDDVDDGQIAAVLLEDDDTAVCKRITHVPNGLILISDNSTKYPPMYVSNCRILGRVREITRRL